MIREPADGPAATLAEDDSGKPLPLITGRELQAWKARLEETDEHLKEVYHHYNQQESELSIAKREFNKHLHRHLCFQ